MKRRKRISYIATVILILTVVLAGCAQLPAEPVPTPTAEPVMSDSGNLETSQQPDPAVTAPPAQTEAVTAGPTQSAAAVQTPESTLAPKDTPLPTPEATAGDPQQPQDQETLTCTLAISCATVLDNLEQLTKGKEVLIPENGWILYEEDLAFTEGESVFDVLKRELTDRLIHMEFATTPLYGSIYIESINNLYEFDCGALSGWMYRVNGVYPNYSCSEFALSDGDVIEWLYTCDLGADIGGGNFLE